MTVTFRGEMLLSLGELLEKSGGSSDKFTANMVTQAIAQPDPQPATAKILHLEDSKLDAEIIGYFLMNGGFPCTITLVSDMPSFEKALTKEIFDLILCDQNLPGWTGANPSHLARTLQPATPIVVLSGNLDNFENSGDTAVALPWRVLKSELAALVPAVRQALEASRGSKSRAAA